MKRWGKAESDIAARTYSGLIQTKHQLEPRSEECWIFDSVHYGVDENFRRGVEDREIP